MAVYVPLCCLLAIAVLLPFASGTLQVTWARPGDDQPTAIQAEDTYIDVYWTCVPVTPCLNSSVYQNFTIEILTPTGAVYLRDNVTTFYFGSYFYYTFNGLGDGALSQYGQDGWTSRVTARLPGGATDVGVSPPIFMEHECSKTPGECEECLGNRLGCGWCLWVGENNTKTGHTGASFCSPNAVAFTCGVDYRQALPGDKCPVSPGDRLLNPTGFMCTAGLIPAVAFLAALITLYILCGCRYRKECNHCEHDLHHAGHHCEVIVNNPHRVCICVVTCGGYGRGCHGGEVCNCQFTRTHSTTSTATSGNATATATATVTVVQWCQCQRCSCQKCVPTLDCGCSNCSCSKCLVYRFIWLALLLAGAWIIAMAVVLYVVYLPFPSTLTAFAIAMVIGGCIICCVVPAGGGAVARRVRHKYFAWRA